MSDRAAAALYRELTIKKRHGGVEGVARKLGVAYSTMHAYCEGRRGFPPKKVGMLYENVGDLDLVDEIAMDLLGLHGVMLVAKPSASAATPDEVRAQCMRVAKSSGEIQGGFVEALADGVIDALEDEQLDELIDRHQRDLEILRALKRSRTLRPVGVVGSRR